MSIMSPRETINMIDNDVKIGLQLFQEKYGNRDKFTSCFRPNSNFKDKFVEMIFFEMNLNAKNRKKYATYLAGKVLHEIFGGLK